jgi:beta-lactamase regulating signal transducer with metallopeptidase domain
VNLVASVAILVVLVLRPIVLRRVGANIAYWLWLIVPIVAIASFVPAHEQVLVVPPYSSTTVVEESLTSVDDSPRAAQALTPTAATAVYAPSLADVSIALWLLGAMALLARSIASTRRFARDPSVGPALVGVFRPRLVLPADFETRFDARERGLILAHEDMHRASGHTIVNALVEIARCLSWFNPLAHFAANRFRMDQELACDAAVIATRPGERRTYAQALLRTQLGTVFLPLGCTWTSRSAKRIAERIEMVGRSPIGVHGRMAGALGIVIIGAALGFAAWAQQPARQIVEVTGLPEVWTPSADAPANTLTQLEADRHDRFIARAQAGDIDLVFFGTTDTEMWHWKDRGLTAWNQWFGSMKAANFGSQGTRPSSLVWRMQNGELAGYQAKLVILSAPGVAGDVALDADSDTDVPQLIASYEAVIAEIRARQPHAKILLLAPFPRGFADRDGWREIAQTRAIACSELIDDETVFYADFGERFYLPDGTHDRTLWSRWGGEADFDGVGIQPLAFDVWAEELQPWLDRFVR